MVRCIYRQAGTPLADDQDQSLVPDKEGVKELVDRYTLPPVSCPSLTCCGGSLLSAWGGGRLLSGPSELRCACSAPGALPVFSRQTAKKHTCWVKFPILILMKYLLSV